MSNAIRFLESMGASDSLRAASDYEAAVRALDVESAQQTALLDRDSASLAGLLLARPTMFCMILAPDEGKEDELPDQADEQTDGDEDRGEKE